MKPPEGEMQRILSGVNTIAQDVPAMGNLESLLNLAGRK
jgi:hypothetical protein